MPLSTKALTMINRDPRLCGSIPSGSVDDTELCRICGFDHDLDEGLLKAIDDEILYLHADKT